MFTGGNRQDAVWFCTWQRYQQCYFHLASGFDGIFPYKRLSFGVNAALEKYQHITTQFMADLKGVANIADDLIVHGWNKEEHERNLTMVLDRLKEKKLTLNAKKCTFQMTTVVFMGPKS